MAIERGTHSKIISYAKFILGNAKPLDIPWIIYAKLSGNPKVFRLNDGTITRNINGPFFMALPYKKRLVDEKNLLYEWEVEGRRIYATDMQIGDLIGEYLVPGEFDRNYGSDYAGATVLDVGGFVGDTAMYFLEKGAKKVVIYEPVPENILAINHNLAPYAGRFEVIESAAGASDGEITLVSQSPPGRFAFGDSKGGKFALHAKCAAFSTILKNGKFDMAKVDCEGCEVSLLDLPSSLLASIPKWIIEVHSSPNWPRFIEKFAQAGFRLEKQVGMNDEITILHFSSGHGGSAQEEIA